MSTISTETTGSPPCRSLPAQQAVLMSRDEGEAYREKRSLPPSGLSREDVGFLACARLEWLLKPARAELNGQFCAGDIQELLNSFAGEIFHPGTLDWMVEDLGVYLAEEIEEEGQRLAQKLQNLTPVQRLALADALELAWYRSDRNKSPFEVLAELGVELA